jgi:ABC-type multidrug transport system permease subunit
MQRHASLTPTIKLRWVGWISADFLELMTIPPSIFISEAFSMVTTSAVIKSDTAFSNNLRWWSKPRGPIIVDKAGYLVAISNAILFLLYVQFLCNGVSKYAFQLGLLDASLSSYDFSTSWSPQPFFWAFGCLGK